MADPCLSAAEHQFWETETNTPWDHAVLCLWKGQQQQVQEFVYMSSDMQCCELAHILECQHTAFEAKGAEGQLSASVDG